MTTPNHRDGSRGCGSTSLLLSAFLRIEGHCGKLTAVAVSIALSVPAHLAGQTFQGRALDEMTNAPVATTLVLLISEDGNLRGSSLADASGFYSIDAPGLGIYRLEGEMLGYENFLRSEEHTSELQSRTNLVCRLLLEKKKKTTDRKNTN